MELTLPEKIKALRKEKNMTQRELADKCGVPLDTIKSWESGRRVPNDDVMATLTGLFRVTNVYLSDEKKKKTEKDEMVWAYFLDNSERCLKDALHTACIDIAHYIGADPYELWGRYVMDSAKAYSRHSIKEERNAGK